VDVLFKKTICLEETDVWFVLNGLYLNSNQVIDELAELSGVGNKYGPLQKRR
jgi:hypothetical protein